MKKLLLGCLLAAPLHLLAQTIGLAELKTVLRTCDADSIHQLLEAKGFRPTNDNNRLAWSYQGNLNATRLYKTVEEFDITTHLTLTDPYYYNELLNQMPLLGYHFTRAKTDHQYNTLYFSNNEEEILLIRAYGAEAPREFTILMRMAEGQATAKATPKTKTNATPSKPRTLVAEVAPATPSKPAAKVNVPVER